MDGDAAELNERGRAVLVLQPLGGGAGVLTPGDRVVLFTATADQTLRYWGRSTGRDDRAPVDTEVRRDRGGSVLGRIRHAN